MGSWVLTSRVDPPSWHTLPQTHTQLSTTVTHLLDAFLQRKTGIDPWMCSDPSATPPDPQACGAHTHLPSAFPCHSHRPGPGAWLRPGIQLVFAGFTSSIFFFFFFFIYFFFFSQAPFSISPSQVCSPHQSLQTDLSRDTHLGCQESSS